MKNTVFLLCCLLWVGTAIGQNFGPVSRTCKGCPQDWIFPHINYKGSLSTDGTCTVAFDWDWKHEAVNPYMNFDCQYQNGEPCNKESTSACGSCQTFVISDISVVLDPYVRYTDGCGNSFSLRLADVCIHEESSSAAMIPKADYFCPPFTQCSGCAPDWGPPTFRFQGTSVTAGFCDLNIEWSWIYNANNDNPNLIFTCIYGANGHYCGGSQSVCASCGNITFNSLEMSLDPYIDYSDTCSNIAQYQIETCGFFTVHPNTTKPASTTVEPPTQPETTTTRPTTQPPTQPPTTQPPTQPPTTQPPTQPPTTQPPSQPPTTQPPTQQPTTEDQSCTALICGGCPTGFVKPNFTQSALRLPDHHCTVTFTWDYPYPAGENETRMTFECIYTDGMTHCQPLDERVCGSCERFVIHNIETNQAVHFDYSDSCGNSERILLTNLCTPAKRIFEWE